MPKSVSYNPNPYKQAIKRYSHYSTLKCFLLPKLDRNISYFLFARLTGMHTLSDKTSA